MDQDDSQVQPHPTEYFGVYQKGTIRLSGVVDWPDGTPVLVHVADIDYDQAAKRLGKVIIAGFGLAGRWLADIFDRHGIEYVIVERNTETIEAQRKIGRIVIEGNISDEDTLRRAGIEEASILALTVPDEQAVLEATRLARAIKPELYIVARTLYSSAGMQASQFGADEVIKAEQAVARQFYEMLLRKIASKNQLPNK